MDDWRAELSELCKQELKAIEEANLVRRLDDAEVGMLDVIYAYRLLLGRWPEFRGVKAYRQRIGSARLHDFVKTFLESEEFRVRTADTGGMDMIVMRELPEMRLFFNMNDRQAVRIAAGAHEPEIQQAMRQLLEPGMNCIDAGAHIGLYTMIMAQGGGQVWSFEPLAGTYQLLKRNVAENGFGQRVHVTNAACHEQAGTAKFYLPERGDMGSAFILPVEKAGGVAGAVTEVAMVRIDDVVPQDVRIGLVKMDIEGNEPFALRGMKRILERDRPILFSEFLPGAMGIKAQDHLAWLRGHGYELFEVAEYLNGARRPYQYHEGEPATNLVCLRRG